MKRPIHVTFSEFNLGTKAVEDRLMRVLEADIRDAHGERVARPVLPEIPDHIYQGLIHSLDEDLKEHEGEVEAWHRALKGWIPL